jgi:hypothetical protein
VKRSSLGLLAMAALLATTSAYAQGSATPTEGMSRPAPVSPGTTTAPASPRTTTGAAPAQPSGIGHLPNGNPERPATSTQTHEPPSK